MKNYLQIFEGASESFAVIKKWVSSIVDFFKKKREDKVEKQEERKKESSMPSAGITINNYGTIDKVVNVYVVGEREAENLMKRVTGDKLSPRNKRPKSSRRRRR